MKLGRSVRVVCYVNVQQSSCEVSASLTDVGGVAVGAIDLMYCSLSVPRFVSLFDVSQLLTWCGSRFVSDADIEWL